jgi:hypothetical protein
MKKTNLLLFAFLIGISCISSCKKDDDTNNNNNNNTSNPMSQTFGGSPTIPAGAAGALYAVNNYVISDDGFGDMDTTEVGTAYAWFDSYTATKNAGTVTANSLELDDNFGGAALPWYYTISNYPMDFSSSNTVNWSVAGNSSAGITGFTHTDNTAYPKCNFNIPATINLNSSFTVTSTNIGSNDAVFYTIYGQGTPKVTKSMPANATSATFTSAELHSVASSGGLIGVQVMPVKLTQATENSKTYYFVKQWAFARFATAN